MFCRNSRNICLFVSIVLLTAVGPLAAGESARGRELRRQLSTVVDFKGIEDARATLSDALDALSKRFSLTFDINEAAFKEAEPKKKEGLTERLARLIQRRPRPQAEPKKEVGGTEIANPTPIPEMHTNLGRILRKILTRLPASATYIIRDDVIEITTTEAVRKEFFADRPSMSGPLPPLVSGAFDKVPLETVLKELNAYGNVVLDVRGSEEAQAPVTADLANVPLDTAVRMFADMAGLKVVSLDNVLYVTSVENADALREEQKELRRQREREQKDKNKKAREKEKKPAEPRP